MNPRLVVLLLCASLLAAVHAQAKTILPDACGDDKVTFDVSTQKNPPPPAPPAAGKAQIVFVESVNRIDQGGCIGCDVVTRVGVDGAWVGANKGKSYFAYTVEPGEHHLCVDWQSVLGKLRQKVGMDSFVADPGNVYYYQIKVTIYMDINADTGLTVDLVPLSADEGKYQVKLSALSTSKPK
jgi:hypothetical protein